MTRRQLIQSFVFAGLLLLVLFAVRLWLLTGVREVTYGETGKINMLMKHHIDPDVMVFGASVANVHFNDSLITAQSGLQTVNFGIDGTSYEQYCGLLHEFTSYTKKCKYVVFANNFFEYIPRQHLYEGYKFYAHLNNDHIYKSLHHIDGDLIWKMRHVPFYDLLVYDERFFEEALEGWRRISQHLPEQPERWFRPIAIYNFTEKISRKQLNIKSFKIVVDTHIVEDFHRDIQALNAKGIKVIVMLTPVHTSAYKQLSNVEGVRKVTGKLAKDHNNIFMDYTLWPNCSDSSLFYNFTHMNARGADVFSSDFAKELRKIDKGR